MSTSDPPSSSHWRASLYSASRKFRSLSPPAPILASEALREDIAPRYPGAVWARLACALAGVLLFSLGVWNHHLPHATGSISPQLVHELAFRVGIIPLGLWGLLWGASLLLALVPLPYVMRALGMIMVGTCIVVARHVPSSLWVWWVDGAPRGAFEEQARLLAMCTLPAALLFRSHYRAYAGARIILACALALALPFVLVSLRLAVGGGDRFAQFTGVAGVLSFLGAFAGFMGAGTTAMGSTLAVLTLLIGVGQTLGQPGSWPSGWVETSRWIQVEFLLASASLIAMGLFQLLAQCFSADARRANVFLPLE